MGDDSYLTDVQMLTLRDESLWWKCPTASLRLPACRATPDGNHKNSTEAASSMHPWKVIRGPDADAPRCPGIPFQRRVVGTPPERAQVANPSSQPRLVALDAVTGCWHPLPAPPPRSGPHFIPTVRAHHSGRVSGAMGTERSPLLTRKWNCLNLITLFNEVSP